MALSPLLTMLLVPCLHHCLLHWVLHWFSNLHHLHETTGVIISSIGSTGSPPSFPVPSHFPSTLTANSSHNHLDPLPYNLLHHPLNNDFTIHYPLYLLHCFSLCSFGPAISSSPLSPLSWPFLPSEWWPPWRGSPHLTAGTLCFFPHLPSLPFFLRVLRNAP